ncbi:hypothetical protein M1N22_03440 [Dehalococcoidia bacterium]|nr:hypothetical protein [Dehalococcoidia bacterium]
MPDVDIGTVIIGIQAVVLLATLIFMYYQYRKTMSVMSAQVSLMSDELSEIRKEIRITAHEDIYEKLFTLYYKYIEYADDLKDIFRSHAKLNTSEVRKQYMMFAVLDLLYLMYLQRDTLDRGLLKTWETWTKRIFEEPKIFEIYETVKDEYDPEYIRYIEGVYKNKKSREV